MLETSWPADLSRRDEQVLRAAGRSRLRADATGRGRREQGVVAPAFSRFRIQAAIARRGTRPDQAVVHLVWAGADRGGTYTDGRITDLHFTRSDTKGQPQWVPTSRL
ncbi:hypothetical protein ACFQVC_32835 [Streptomyces monticola]|uniref:Uncharacterized protein n=1 Tax=Streptomyces monticola TaxID=2666263 RepID=A0ABW2JUF8_9ACTN